jgi:hypothetical protein
MAADAEVAAKPPRTMVAVMMQAGERNGLEMRGFMDSEFLEFGVLGLVEKSGAWRFTKRNLV